MLVAWEDGGRYSEYAPRCCDDGEEIEEVVVVFLLPRVKIDKIPPPLPVGLLLLWLLFDIAWRWDLLLDDEFLEYTDDVDIGGL